MKKLWRRIAAAGMVAALALGLSACELGGGGMSKMDASYYVKGLMEQYYLGVYDKDFLEYMEMTENEAKESHQENISIESDSFITYFNIAEDPATMSDEIMTQVRDLYTKIYEKAKFTVGGASKLESGGYGVEVSVEPIDVIKNTEAELDTYLAEYMPADVTQEEVNAMSEEAYATYQEAWTAYEESYPQLVVDLLKTQVDKLGYLETKSFVMQVKSETKDNVETWFMTDDDQQKFDEYIIYYPGYSNFEA